MRKVWGVLLLVFVGAILLRLAWDALLPILPVIIIVGVVVLIAVLFRGTIGRFITRRSRF